MATKAVWKYSFERQQFSMTIVDLVRPRVVLVGQDPKGVDPELCTVWVEHEVSGDGPPPSTDRLRLGLFGSGDPISINPWAEHVGSAVCGNHVWHVYKV